MKIMGRPLDMAAEMLLSELGISDKLTPSDFKSKVMIEYEKLYPSALLFPGAEKLIRHLKKSGIPIAISTGSSQRRDINSFEILKLKF